MGEIYDIYKLALVGRYLRPGESLELVGVSSLTMSEIATDPPQEHCRSTLNIGPSGAESTVDAEHYGIYMSDKGNNRIVVTASAYATNAGPYRASRYSLRCRRARVNDRIFTLPAPDASGALATADMFQVNRSYDFVMHGIQAGYCKPSDNFEVLGLGQLDVVVDGERVSVDGAWNVVQAAIEGNVRERFIDLTDEYGVYIMLNTETGQLQAYQTDSSPRRELAGYTLRCRPFDAAQEPAVQSIDESVEGTFELMAGFSEASLGRVGRQAFVFDTDYNLFEEAFSAGHVTRGDCLEVLGIARVWIQRKNKPTAQLLQAENQTKLSDANGTQYLLLNHPEMTVRVKSDNRMSAITRRHPEGQQPSESGCTAIGFTLTCRKYPLGN